MRRLSTLIIAASLLGTATTTWSQDVRTRNLIITGGNGAPNIGTMNTVVPLTAPRTYTLPDLNGFLIVSPVALTPNTGLVSNNLGQVVSVTQTDGEILIGSTGNAPAAGSLIGIRGIGVTYNAGDLEISLPTGATDNSLRFDGTNWVAETDFLIDANGSITSNGNATLGDNATDVISVTGTTTINGGASTATTSIGNASGGTITLDAGNGDLTLLNIDAATNPVTAQVLLLESNNVRTANIGDVAWLVGGNSLGGGGNQLIGNLDDDRFEIITNGTTRIYVGDDANDDGNVSIGDFPLINTRLYVTTTLPNNVGLAVTSSFEGVRIDATDAGLIIGDNTAPVSGIEVDASTTGIIVGGSSSPAVGVSSSASSLSGVAYLAQNALISFSGDGSTQLGDGSGTDNVDIQLGIGELVISGLQNNPSANYIVTQDISGVVHANPVNGYVWLVGGNTLDGSNTSEIFGVVSNTAEDIDIRTANISALIIDGSDQSVNVQTDLNVTANTSLGGTVTATGLSTYTAGDDFVVINGSDELEVRTIANIVTGTGTANQMTRWLTSSTIGDASLADDGSGTLSRAGNLAINVGTGNDITTDGGITSAENVTITSGGLTVSAGGAAITGNSTITGTLGVSAGLTVSAGGATITAGGLTVSADGAAITGNSTITGTLGVSAGLTVSAGGATVTGNSDFNNDVNVDGNTTLVGTLDVTGATTLNSTLAVNGNTTLGDAGADAVTINAATVTAANLPVGTGDVFVMSNAGALETRTITNITTGTGTPNQMTRWLTASTLGDASLADDGSGTLSRAGNLAINVGTGNDITTDGGITSAENVTITSGGLTVSAGGATVTGNSDFNNDVNVDGNTTLVGTLDVTGATTLNSTLAVNGNTTLGDAGADAVTINAATVTAANLPVGTGDVFVMSNAGALETRTITNITTGTGTPNQMTRWLTASTLGDASLADDGSGTLSRAGNLAINVGTGNDITTDGGITSAENVTITSGGLTVSAGGATITAGGLTVSADGAAITGNSTITGTLGVSAGLTVSAGGATVTGNSDFNNDVNVDGNTTLAGTLDVTGATTLNSTLAVNGNTTLGDAGADAVTINAATVTAANLPVGTGDVFVMSNAGALETRTITNITTGTGTPNQMTRWITASTLGDASLADDGSGTLSRAGNLAINVGTGNDITTDGGITSAENVTITSGGLTVSAGATSLGGTLDVTGATTLSSTLDVTGVATLSSNLIVNGNSTLGNADTDVNTILGVTTINGTGGATTTIGSTSAGAVSVTSGSTVDLSAVGNASLSSGADVEISSTAGDVSILLSGNAGDDLILDGIEVVNPIEDLLWITAANEVRRSPFSGTANEGVAFESGAYRLGGNAVDINPIESGRVVTVGTGGVLSFQTATGAENMLQLNDNGNVAISSGGTGTTDIGGVTSGSISLYAGNVGSDLTLFATDVLEVDADMLDADFANTVSIDAGTTLELIGGSGVTIIGNSTVTGTFGVTGNSTLTGDLSVTGNTTLGNAGADAVTINAATVTADNIPAGADGDELVTINAAGELRQTPISTVLGTSAWLVGGNTFSTAGARSVGTNSAHDFEILSGGSTRLSFPNAAANILVTADVTPTVGATYNVGSDALRWNGMYVNGAAGQLHIGPANGQSGSTEMVLAYGGTRGTLNVDGGTAEIAIQAGNIEANATIIVDNAGTNNLTIAETGLSRSGSIAINAGTGNDVTTDGGITSAENVTITSGGLTVSAGGATVTGNADFNNDLNADGNTTLGGTLGVTGGTTLSSTLAVNGNTTLGDAGADAVTINAATVTAANLPVGTGDVFVMSNAGALETRTITNITTGTGTPNQMTRWLTASTLGDASLADDGSGTLSRAGNLAINVGTGNDITTDGGITSAENVTITSGGLTVSAGGATVTGNADFNNDVNVDGNSTLGDAATDNVTANGVLTTANAVNVKVNVVNGAGTLDNTNNVVLADANVAAFTITLPAAVDGRTYTIKKIDGSANAVTIDGDGAETIDGAATVALLNVNDFITIVAQGGAWYIIGTN